MSERNVLVPVCDVGLGTGSAWVRDRSRGRLRIPAFGLRLAGRTLCVEAVGFAGERGWHSVTFSDGTRACCRVLAAGGSANDTAA